MTTEGSVLVLASALHDDATADGLHREREAVDDITRRMRTGLVDPMSAYLALNALAATWPQSPMEGAT